MSRLRNIWLLGCAISLTMVVLSSCADKKLGTTDALKAAEAETLITALEKHEPTFEWYSGKAKLKLATEDLRVGATIHVRMIKDSLIWVKIDKLGFEIGRALITPDSAHVVDRLHKEYYIEHLDTFLLQYNAPFTFEDLQRVMAGGTLNGHSENVHVITDENRFGLNMLADKFMAQYWFNKLLLLEQGTFKDDKDRSVTINYGDYRELGLDHPMPFERYLELDDGETLAEISIYFAHIEVNVPKSMPFSIPGHYVKVD